MVDMGAAATTVAANSDKVTNWDFFKAGSSRIMESEGHSNVSGDGSNSSFLNIPPIGTRTKDHEENTVLLIFFYYKKNQPTHYISETFNDILGISFIKKKYKKGIFDIFSR